MSLAALLAAALLPPPVVIMNPRGPGWGQGCLIGPDTAITAWHVVSELPEMRWVSPRSNAVGVAEIIGTEKKKDIATIRLLGAVILPVAPRMKHPKVRPGDRLRFPFSSNNVRDGLLVGLVIGTSHEDPNQVFVDLAAFSGMSGACAVNDAGEIVGIVQQVAWDDKNPQMRSVGIIRLLK